MTKKKVKHFPSDFSKKKPAVSNTADKQSSASKPAPKQRKRTYKKSAETKKQDTVHDMLKPKPLKISTKKGNIKSTEVQQMPLNKYIAHCGICSRRDAIELIKKGKVKLNSLVEVNPAVKVTEADYVMYEGKRLFPQRNLVYYLLNKPKNYITTTDDPENRKTVLDLLKDEDTSRLFPVGRLDRNTTGLLLITNDGELAQKLTHPKYKIKKVYQVTLDKPLTKKDFLKIAEGIVLEDGLAPVDEIAYIDAKDKKMIGIEIHIGRNRIVRRIFESLQYKVVALDRVIYAGLTKKNLPRGTYRKLNEKEIIYLKHF